MTWVAVKAGKQPALVTPHCDAVVSGDDAPFTPARIAGLRIGIDRSFFFAGLHAEVAALTETALARLAAAGR